MTLRRGNTAGEVHILPKIARQRMAEAKAVREEQEPLSSITCKEVAGQWLQYLRDHHAKPSTTHKYNSDLSLR